jgi:hypothetical protein
MQTLTEHMDCLVFVGAVAVFAIAIYKAACMAISEYRENKRKWWLR